MLTKLAKIILTEHLGKLSLRSKYAKNKKRKVSLSETEGDFSPKMGSREQKTENPPSFFPFESPQSVSGKELEAAKWKKKKILLQVREKRKFHQ